jgi:hypothetical protein
MQWYLGLLTLESSLRRIASVHAASISAIDIRTLLLLSLLLFSLRAMKDIPIQQRLPNDLQ